MFKRTGATHISLVGNADRTGSPAYNEELSRRRVDAVRTELESLGVPAAVITVSAEGENAPIVPTAQGVREARNRYVAIDFPEREAARLHTARGSGAAAGSAAPAAEVGVIPGAVVRAQSAGDKFGGQQEIERSGRPGA